MRLKLAGLKFKIKKSKHPAFQKGGQNGGSSVHRQEPMAAWQGWTECWGNGWTLLCPSPRREGQGHVVCGTRSPGLHTAIEVRNISAVPCPHASHVQSKTMLGQSLSIESFCQITLEENPRRKAVAVLDPVPSLPCCFLQIPQ